MQATSPDTHSAKAIDRIELLRERRTDRGASEAESDAAAMAIGRILMRQPALVVVDSAAHATGSRPEIPPPPADDVTLRDVRRLRETDRAVMVRLDNGLTTWFPPSQIVDADWAAGVLTVTGWIWERKREEWGAAA